MKRNIFSGAERLLRLDAVVQPEWLVFFRVAVSLFCLLHFCSLLPDMNYFLSGSAFVHPEIARANASFIVPAIYDLQQCLHGLLEEQQVLYLFSGIYIVQLLCIAAGLGGRINALLTCLFHLMLVNSMQLYVYGLDYFCTIALFYCFLFPVNTYRSLDNLLLRRMGRRRREDQIFQLLCLRLLQLHLCVAYFFGGFDKLIGFNWWNGESLWKAMHMWDGPSFMNVDSLSGSPVFLLGGWLTIITEMLYPIFMNVKKTRNAWLLLIIGLHLCIALFMGLFFFAAFMIILSIAAFYMPYSVCKPSVGTVSTTAVVSAVVSAVDVTKE